MRRVGKIPPWLIYFVSPLPGFVESIFSLALPNITEFFETNKTLAQFSTVNYYLGYSLGILTLGWISDFWGRRPLILCCLIGYSIMSFCMSYVNNIYVFIICRFCHAYAASVCSVVGQAMIRDSYKKIVLSQVYITMSLAMSIIPSIGYLLGGFMIQIYNWIYAFRFIGFMIFALFIVCMYFLPETTKHTKPSYKDLLENINEIFQDTKFFLNALIVGLFNGILYGFYMQAPFIFIHTMKISVAHYSQIILIINCASLCGAIISKSLIKCQFQIKQIKILGLCLSFLGLLILFTLSYFKDYYLATNKIISTLTIALPFMVHLIGHSLLIPLVLSTSLRYYNNQIGAAGSIFGSCYYLISALTLLVISRISKQNMDGYSLLSLSLVFLSIVFFAINSFLQKNR